MAPETEIQRYVRFEFAGCQAYGWWRDGAIEELNGSIYGAATPDKLLGYISQFVTLMPGDVILTGTPGKTQAVTHGDTIEIEIEGVGRLCNSVVGQRVRVMGA